MPKYNYKVTNKKLYEEYEFAPCTGTVIALRRAKTFVDTVSSGEEVGILLDRTNFYAEQGGQIYDEGFLVKVEDDDTEVRIKNVQVRGGYVLHIGTVGQGTLKKGDKVSLNIDTIRRRLSMSNHTATHALNYALRKVLGTDVDQKGSLVAPDRLRFDFTSKGAMTADQVRKTEEITMNIVRENKKVYAKESSLALAKTIQGLRAMFEETYPDPVRIVSIGVPVENLEKDPLAPHALHTSVEFCGGTHLHYTQHIGDFVIASEEAIAKGIRRIVGLTGPEATKAQKKADILQNHLDQLQATIAADKSGANAKDHVKKIVELTDDVSHATISSWKKDKMRKMLKDLKKTLDDKERAAKTAIANAVVDTVQQMIQQNVGLPVFVEVLEAYSNTKALDSALKKIKAVSPETSALLISVDPDAKKIFALSAASKSAISKGLKANEWIQEIAPLMGGKGGGKPESAQASGPNISCVTEIAHIAKNFANIKLELVEDLATQKHDRSKNEEKSTCPEMSNYKLVLSGNSGSIKYYRAQIAAKYGNKELITSEEKDNDKTSKNIKLKGNDFELSDSNAIAFYLSNDELRCASDPFAFSEVLQWLSYADNHILPAALGWIVPCLSDNLQNNMKTNIKTSKEDALSSLKKLDNILYTKTYLVGERISLADIAVVTAMIPLYEYVLDPACRKPYTHLNRWFFTVLNQPQVASVIKNFQLCEKAVKQ